MGCVSVGGYRLRLGDQSGASLIPLSPKGRPFPPDDEGSSPLSEALEGKRGEREPPPTAAVRFEDAVADASTVTGKVERALTLFKEVAQHRLDPSEASDEVDALVGFLRKLDHEKRFEDVLRVAHALATLLGLIERWIELLRSLESALSAAERLGDTAGKAWALHELGTLNLAAGRDADADRMLGEAHELRRRANDAHGMETTERNIETLCRKLRARLHHEPKRGVLEWLVHRPAIAISLAGLMLIAGGVAGAATQGSRNAADTVSAISSPGGKTGAVDGKGTPSGKTTTGTTAGKSTGKTTTGKTTAGKTSGPQPSRPSIGSASVTTFEEGSYGGFEVTAAGTPKPTITASGRLPNGVTFNGNVLSGVATANGRFQIVFTATNSAGTASQGFTLIVAPGTTATTEQLTPTVAKPEAPPPREG